MNRLKKFTKRGALGRGFARASARAVTLLGPDPASRIKDAIRIEGFLDYPRARIKMVVDSPLQLGRLHACQKEPETVSWLEATFRAGDVLYDVGANVGAYSLVADAIAQGRGSVYAFEPGSATFAALASNVLLNGCGERVVALQLALGARTELTTLNYSSLRAGAASHSVGSPAGGVPGLRQTIVGFRLDELVRMFGLRPPTHIKIDVDGGELEVLRGARETLASGSIRDALVEVDDANGRAVLELLTELGYEETARHPRLAGRSANVILRARANSR